MEITVPGLDRNLFTMGTKTHENEERNKVRMFSERESLCRKNEIGNVKKKEN